MTRPRVPRSARFALAVPGRYRLLGRDSWQGVRLVNLSDTGILFRAHERIVPGTMFEMIIETPFQIGNLAPGRFGCVARICRAETVTSPDEGYPVGAEFVEFRMVDDES